MYNTDWHIHSEASYDASLSLDELIASVKAMGIKEFGITDHANVNIPSFWDNMHESRRLYDEHKFEGFHFGVELTTIPKSLYDYCAKHGTRDGYVYPSSGESCDLEFMLTLEDMERLGIMYSVAAAHSTWNIEPRQDLIIREWHRQQMYIAQDPRVDVLAHPWWCWASKKWTDSDMADFSIIPRSMHDELAAALMENEVCIEANPSMIFGEVFPERFYRQYNEYLRYMFEKGVKLVFGSDVHHSPYKDHRLDVERALGSVGFTSEDFSKPKIHNR
jgi:histidinol phosphatase-like PHP family hydrolase